MYNLLQNDINKFLSLMLFQIWYFKYGRLSYTRILKSSPPTFMSKRETGACRIYPLVTSRRPRINQLQLQSHTLRGALRQLRHILYRASFLQGFWHVDFQLSHRSTPGVVALLEVWPVGLRHGVFLEPGGENLFLIRLR